MQIEPGMLAQAKSLSANIAAVARLLAVRGVLESGWARACFDLRLTAGA